MGMGFVQSWKTLTVCRALLGVFEAGCKSFDLVRRVSCQNGLTLAIKSIPRRHVHHWLLVSPVRDC